jgi:hypothetical protein
MTGFGLLMATRAFVGTNPADEPTASSLLVMTEKAPITLMGRATDLTVAMLLRVRA